MSRNRLTVYITLGVLVQLIAIYMFAFFDWSAVGPKDIVTVEFVSGSTQQEIVVEVEVGSNVERPSTFYNPGYYIGGWYEDPVLGPLRGDAWKFLSDPITEHTTLYIDWIPINYQLDYHYQGSSVIVDMVMTPYNSNVDLIVPTREGYIFDGWYTDTTLLYEVTHLVMPRHDVDLYAKWIPLEFPIIFYDEDYQPYAEVYFPTGLPIDETQFPALPEVEGYVFIGWDQDLPTNMPNYTLTLLPQFEIGKFMIQLVDYDGSILLEGTYPYQTDISEFLIDIVPEREGYTFIGWDTVLPNTMPGHNIYITALYEAD